MAGDCPVDGDFLHVPSFLAVVAASKMVAPSRLVKLAVRLAA